MSHLRTPYSEHKHREARVAVINHYGGCCAVCGEKTLAFLAIDHVGGGGRQHLTAIKTPNLTKWLVLHDFPVGFRVLCHNHNYIAYLLQRPPLLAIPYRKSTKPYRKGGRSSTAEKRKYRAKLRADVLDAYGRHCACCRESDERVLTIDHIDSNGAEERRRLGCNRRNSHGVYGYLRKNGFPSGYQTLCFNCNLGRACNKGRCPHKD